MINGRGTNDKSSTISFYSNKTKDDNINLIIDIFQPHSFNEDVF